MDSTITNPNPEENQVLAHEATGPAKQKMESNSTASNECFDCSCCCGSGRDVEHCCQVDYDDALASMIGKSARNGRRVQRSTGDQVILPVKCTSKRRQFTHSCIANLGSSCKSQLLHRPFTISPRRLFILFVINTVLSQLNQIQQQYLKLNANNLPPNHSILPQQIFVQAQGTTDNDSDYCSSNNDCGYRICHENKCTCPRNYPVENKERSECLPNEQCLSGSQCIDGICSCGPNHISLYNPSTKVFYCHPKRGLNEECNNDAQCPDNAFCSSKKHGCLCQNGYGQTIVKINDAETNQCLPISCTVSSNCATEFHICEENKCTCLATHFDPHTAKCYKFGLTGGQPNDGSALNVTGVDNQGSNTQTKENDRSIDSILKHLTESSDGVWLIVVILVVVAVILLSLMVCLVRRYCLGYCWTTHKKDYEPNSPTRNSFNKDSINNKSFRQKRGEVDEDDNERENSNEDRGFANADRLKLMTASVPASNNNGTKSRSNGNDYVIVNV